MTLRSTWAMKFNIQSKLGPVTSDSLHGDEQPADAILLATVFHDPDGKVTAHFITVDGRQKPADILAGKRGKDDIAMKPIDLFTVWLLLGQELLASKLPAGCKRVIRTAAESLRSEVGRLANQEDESSALTAVPGAEAGPGG